MKKSLILSSILSLLSILFFQAPSQAQTEACNLPFLTTASDQTQKTGTIDVQILFLRFPDSGKKSKTYTKQFLEYVNLKEIENYVKETSYGKAKVKFHINYKWVDLPNNSYDYGLQFNMNENQENSYRDAIVNASSSVVDYSKIDSIYAIPDPELSQFYTAFRNAAFINGRKIMMVLYNETSAFQATHEIFHTLGLRDLYGGFNIYGVFGGMEQYSLMSQVNGGTNILGFEKYSLGWIKNNEIICHTSGSNQYKISTLDSKGMKLVLVPINSGELIGIENRKNEKRDKYLGGSGILVYHINSNLYNDPKHSSSINPLFFGKNGFVEFSGVTINVKKNVVTVTK